MYGGAERVARRRRSTGRRDEAIVATKIWARSVDEGREQFARQLELVRPASTSSRCTTSSRGASTCRWLEAERDAGRIGRLGVTHYAARPPSASSSEALRTRTLRDACRCRYNPHERECEQRAPAARRGARRRGDRDAAARRGRARAPRAAARELEPLARSASRPGRRRSSSGRSRIRRSTCVIPATADPEHARENARRRRAALARRRRSDGLVERLAARGRTLGFSRR